MSIPDVRTPGVFVEINASAPRGLATQQHRILVLGLRLAAGQVDELVPTQILSGDQAEAAFGRGSQLTAMLRALKTANRRTEVWAIALDPDAAGAAAAATLTFTGPATKAGTLAVYVAGVLVSVPVAVGDTAAVVAAAVAAAINALTHLPATAAQGTDANTHVVTLTCRWKGECGNGLDARLNYGGEAMPAGLACEVVAFAGGTTDPSVADALALLGDTQYHTVITGLAGAANMTLLEADMESRWDPLRQTEGHVFAGVVGSQATMAGVGNARNSRFSTLVGGGKSPTPPWVWAAVTGAVDAAEPDPARPRQTLWLPGVLPASRSERLSREERDLLLHDGISTHVADDSGRVTIERLITTHQTSELGVPDARYLDIETMRTLAYLRYDYRSAVALAFPRHKLASDGAVFDADQLVVTPGSMRAFTIARAQLWERRALIEDGEQFAADLFVARSTTDVNRIDAELFPNLINQFRVFAAGIGFLN